MTPNRHPDHLTTTANAVAPKTTQPLTARAVAALKPRATRYAVSDTDVSGLQLRVHPDGTKIWSIRYRINGEQKRLRLGEYGEAPRMGLADARKDAQRVLRKVDGGIDPQAERAAAKRAAEQAKKDSIEALCADYIERWAKPRKRTWRDDQSKLTNEVLPKWKNRPVSSITRRDCRALVQAIADRPAPIHANRVVALLSKLFRFALNEEIIETNPAAQLPKPGVEAQARPEGEREQKPYTHDEIRRIWANTEDLPTAQRVPIRLGLLTGQRPGECAELEWPEIDGSWWTIPSSRIKNGRTQRVYLTSMALDELARVPRIEDQPRAFVGAIGTRQRREANVAIFAGVSSREKPRHALRDTVATGLAECGVDTEDISRVLNHKFGSAVTAGYNAYQYDREKRLALTKWARTLDGIVNPRKAAKVLRHAPRGRA